MNGQKERKKERNKEGKANKKKEGNLRVRKT